MKLGRLALIGLAAFPSPAFSAQTDGTFKTVKLAPQGQKTLHLPRPEIIAGMRIKAPSSAHLEQTAEHTQLLRPNASQEEAAAAMGRPYSGAPRQETEPHSAMTRPFALAAARPTQALPALRDAEWARSLWSGKPEEVSQAAAALEATLADPEQVVSPELEPLLRGEILAYLQQGPSSRPSLKSNGRHEPETSIQEIFRTYETMAAEKPFLIPHGFLGEMLDLWQVEPQSWIRDSKSFDLSLWIFRKLLTIVWYAGAAVSEAERELLKGKWKEIEANAASIAFMRGRNDPLLRETRAWLAQMPRLPELPARTSREALALSRPLRQDKRIMDLDAPAARVLWARDGSSFIVGTENGELSLWDPRRRKPLWTMSMGEQGVKDLALSPDGETFFILLKDDAKIYQRGWLDGEKREIITIHEKHTEETLLSLAVSPESHLLAGLSSEGRIWIWATATGALRKIIQTNNISPGDRAIQWTPDGRKLAWVDWHATTGKIMVIHLDHYSVETGLRDRRPISIRRQQKHEHFVSISPDGNSLVLSSMKCTMLDNISHDSVDARWTPILEIVHSGPLSRLNPSRYITMGRETASRVTNIAWSPDGRLLATAEDNGRVVIWDAASLKPIQSPWGHSGTVNAIAFSPDGKWLLTGGSDKTARLHPVQLR
ncbi:MAG: hypothetical protein HY921_12210 [Elusimicrobia bacterium]|nr:hypothetical protein [Elusimicrobiota bacterium]